MASARERRERGLGRAGDGEEARDHRAGALVEPGAGGERRLLEEAVGDLAGRAAADRADAGDRQQILDDAMRRVVVGAVERGEEARMRRGLGRLAAREPRDQPPPAAARSPKARARRRCQTCGDAERVEHGREQRGVADAHVRRARRRGRDRVERERQHVGVGGGAVGPAERFDAGLQELAARAGPLAEDRAEIGIVGHAACASPVARWCRQTGMV